ncbi:hypothetical protein AVEN_14055-1 [Araneus ventricosus]|uniref:MATH domain-containing protein n=1 Tax=Araneus ventricosus TaxID=182803 RepID=A0A4Y2PGV7_ARAVE|nr:hypothetical protein AVEN_14055-1 [Araneus ventricosus]
MNSERKEFTFFWFIENYSYCWHKNGEALISPNFSADGLEGTAWNLHLYPRGARDEDKGHTSLMLNRSESDEGPDSATIKLKMSALAAKGPPRSFVEQYAFKRGGRTWMSQVLKNG